MAVDKKKASLEKERSFCLIVVGKFRLHAEHFEAEENPEAHADFETVVLFRVEQIPMGG